MSELSHKTPPTVSIITRCKGRLKNLQQTLRIMLHQDYYYTEVIVVNYNSPDGLHEWLVNEFKQQIDIGRLIETYVSNTLYFDHPHSRNIGLKAAIGDFVMFLDSDVVAHTELISHLVKRIGDMENTFAMVGYPTPIDCSGIIFARRKDLVDLGGFQESFNGWGYEDGDMRDRLFLNGREMFSFNPKYVHGVDHYDYERYMYFKPPYNIQTDKNWKKIVRDDNREKSLQYIKANGIIANKNTTWGNGGEILFNGKRYLERIVDSKESLVLFQELYKGMKGAYVLFWGPTGECINEKELLDAGCPKAYLDRAKKSKAEKLFKQVYNINDIKDKEVFIVPEKIVVDNPDDLKSKPRYIPMKSKDDDIIVDIDEPKQSNI